ncbi:hypothetical protein BGZ58_006266 [Dissophora ornata]|nr:hypothetical protein BGZ58_006266 [Dissophora ornata]
MPSIFSIPEIAATISDHLERDDLRNCVFVNSTWHCTFTPCLWRTLLSTLGALSSFPPNRDSIQEQAFIKYDRHIRTLRTNNPPLLKVGLKYCTHLRALYIPYDPKFPYSSVSFVKDSIVPAMERNTRLEKLVYHYFPSPQFGGDVLPLLTRALEPLKMLTRLDISLNAPIEQEAFLFLARFAKQLHQFSVSVLSIKSSGNGSRSRSSANTRAVATEAIPAIELERTQLRHLRIECNMHKLELALFIPLLKASPDLELLRFPNFEVTTTNLIAQAVKQYCPKLRDIDFHCSSSKLSDQNIADLTATCQGRLQSFQLRILGGFGSLSTEALHANSATLEVVKIQASRLGHYSILHYLLTACPKLRVLDTALGGSQYDLIKFPAKEMVSQPWVCMGLEVFRVPLDEVHDGTEQESHTGEKDNRDSGKKRFDYHLELYQQFAKLTRLQELCVGCIDWYELKRRTQLRFSLESGLETLKELRELRVLDVWNTRHHARRPELEWMCEHWPKLHRIDGVDIYTAEKWWKPNDDVEAGMQVPNRVRAVLTAEQGWESTYMYD